MTAKRNRNTNCAKHEELLAELSRELHRLDSQDVRLSMDEDFEPEAGTLLKVEIGLAFWHLIPEEFQTIIRGLSDGTGSDGIKQAIEEQALYIWHGPSPKQSRDTSP